MWLEAMFIRDDNGVYYVMKEDNGRLVKQTVTVGDTMYDMMEITDGLGEDDWIAFPYGSSAKQGSLTKHGDASEVWQ